MILHPEKGPGQELLKAQVQISINNSWSSSLVPGKAEGGTPDVQARACSKCLLICFEMHGGLGPT